MADFAFLWRIPRGDGRIARISVKLNAEEASLVGRTVKLKAIQRRGTATIEATGTLLNPPTRAEISIPPNQTAIVGTYDAAIQVTGGGAGPYTFTGQIEIYDHIMIP